MPFEAVGAAAIDEDYNLGPAVREKLAENISTEGTPEYEAVVSIAGGGGGGGGVTEAEMETYVTTQLASYVAEADKAGLNTVGYAQAVWIANGGTIPAGTPAYTLVVEAAA